VWHAVCAFACAWSALGSQLAAAQSDLAAPALPGEVNLQLTQCETATYDAAELIALLRVELRGLGVAKLRVEPAPNESASTGSLALIHLGCGGVPATLAIEVADMVGGNRVSRELAIDDVKPSGRARALSIAIASLLESSWSLLAAAPSASVAGAGPTPMPDNVRAALRRRLSANLNPQPLAADVPDELPPVLQPKQPALPTLALRAALIARGFPSRGTGLTGIDLAVAQRLNPLFYLAFDLEAMYGRQLLRNSDGPIAELDTFWMSVGAALHFSTQTQPDFQLGPMLRAVYARVVTSTESAEFTASDRDGWLMMFGLSSAIRFSVTPAWDFFFGADIGYIPGGLTFRADTTRAVSFADLALALRLGFSWNS
jgi:hypothetical protein